MWLLSKATVTMSKVFVDSLLLRVVVNFTPNPRTIGQALLLGLSNDSAQADGPMNSLDESAAGIRLTVQS
jgi:hypothetical protein